MSIKRRPGAQGTTDPLKPLTIDEHTWQAYRRDVTQAVLRRARREGWSRSDIADMLAMLAVVDETRLSASLAGATDWGVGEPSADLESGSAGQLGGKAASSGPTDPMPVAPEPVFEAPQPVSEPTPEPIPEPVPEVSEVSEAPPSHAHTPAIAREQPVTPKVPPSCAHTPAIAREQPVTSESPPSPPQFPPRIEGRCRRDLHDMVGDNLIIGSAGRRECRACRMARQAILKAKKRGVVFKEGEVA